MTARDGTIPASLRYDYEVAPAGKFLYAELTAMCIGKNYCWPADNTLARVLQVGESSVRRHLKNLSDRKHIRIEGYGRTRRIFPWPDEEAKTWGGNLLTDEQKLLTGDHLVAHGRAHNREEESNVLEVKKEPPYSPPKGTAKEFVPPTLEEVKQYREENELAGVIPESFFGYYEDRGWKRNNGKPVKNWKLTMRDWQRRSSSNPNFKTEEEWDKERHEMMAELFPEEYAG